MEDQGFVVSVVSQLEESTVRVDSASWVRPERHALSSQDEVAFDRVQSAGAVESHEIPASDTSNNAGEQASSTDGVALETETRQGQPAGGLHEV